MWDGIKTKFNLIYYTDKIPKLWLIAKTIPVLYLCAHESTLANKARWRTHFQFGMVSNH